MEQGSVGTKIAVLSLTEQDKNSLVSVFKLRPRFNWSAYRQGVIWTHFFGDKPDFISKTAPSHILVGGRPISPVTGEIHDIQATLRSKKVDLVGSGKGHGFTGVVAKYGFGRGPMTRGSKHHRAPGSVGAGTFPARVYPRKKMPGRWGCYTRTYKNIPILKLDLRHGLLWLKGPTPGKKGSNVKLYPVETI